MNDRDRRASLHDGCCQLIDELLLLDFESRLQPATKWLDGLFRDKLTVEELDELMLALTRAKRRAGGRVVLTEAMVKEMGALGLRVVMVDQTTAEKLVEDFKACSP